MATDPQTLVPKKQETLHSLRTQINDLHAEIAKQLKATMDMAWQGVGAVVQCGDLLNKARTIVKSGDWELWVESNCTFAISTARRYMRAADMYRSQISGRSPDFHSVTEMYVAFGLMPPKVAQIRESNNEDVDSVPWLPATQKVDKWLGKTDDQSELDRFRHWLLGTVRLVNLKLGLQEDAFDG